MIRADVSGGNSRPSERDDQAKCSECGSLLGAHADAESAERQRRKVSSFFLLQMSPSSPLECGSQRHTMSISRPYARAAISSL